MDRNRHRGSEHYDHALVEDYLQHRHRPVSSPNLVMEEPAFTRAAGDLSGRRILDLGCGDGTFARRCHAEGCARYLGIDGSEAMIERAQKSTEGRPGIHVQHLDLEDFASGAIDLDIANLDIANPDHAGPGIAVGDIANPDHAAPDIANPDHAAPDIANPDHAAPDIANPDIDRPDLQRFDLVTARMVLHYLEDLGPVFARVRQLLTPGGRLIFTVIHPVVTSARVVPDGPRTSQFVDGYFESGPRHRTWFDTPVVWQHRTIEHYLRLLAETGFTVDAFSECQPIKAEFDGNAEEYRRRLQVPLFLLIGATA